MVLIRNLPCLRVCHNIFIEKKAHIINGNNFKTNWNCFTFIHLFFNSNFIHIYWFINSTDIYLFQGIKLHIYYIIDFKYLLHKCFLKKNFKKKNKCIFIDIYQMLYMVNSLYCFCIVKNTLNYCF